ncbi:MAG: acetylglutamate kinase [Spirochaetia bacterium]|nr:acetylglutamate kinase [Spirochaetia bacterium]
MRAAEFFSTEQGKKYLGIFQDKLFVIKYGGAALESPHMMPYFLEDIAEMVRHGIKIVIVHGGGKKLSQRMKEKNLPVIFENGLRKTSHEAAETAAEVFAELNLEICENLKNFNIEPASYSDGSITEGELIDPAFPDNRIGRVTRIRAEKIDTNKLPVISSIGLDAENKYLNINADLVAVEAAKTLHARKIIFISDVNGIYLKPNDPDAKLSHVTESEIKKLIDDNILTGGMKLKIEMALDALKNGVNKVHFIDGRIEHSIMIEIFTDQGIGTEIVHD